MRRFLVIPLVVAGTASPTSDAAVGVRNTQELASAVHALRASGGTIVMRPGRYAALAVGPRSSRRLTIVAPRGASVGALRLVSTQAVRVRGLAFRPRTQWVRAEIVASAAIRLEHVTVAGTRRLGANLSIIRSAGVTIARSAFTRCGEGKTPTAGYCIRPVESRGIVISESRFADCFGCDFVHGRANVGLAVRRSSFIRARPGPCGRILECHHQDLVHLDGGADVRFNANRFGLQEYGAAQLYLIGRMRRVRITNNVFLGTDPVAPGYMTQIGIWVGNRRANDVPRGVLIANNTILSGASRVLRNAAGPTATSVFLSPLYAGVPRRQRPLLANNVLGLVATPNRLCPFVRNATANVVAAGHTCGATDVQAAPELAADGRPTAASRALIDRADARYATRLDHDERPRDARPDIGAYEFTG